MSATAHPQTRHWVSVHRAALAIVLRSMTLAASLGLLATRLISSTTAAPTPASSVSGVHLQPTDNLCQTVRSGPC